MKRPGVLYRQWESILTLLGFAAFISLPLVQQFFAPPQETNKAENRKLAGFPKFSKKPGKLANSLKKFPAAFDAYYNDHFGFRAELLRLGTSVNETWLGAPTSRRFTPGRAGWVFYNGNDSIADYRGMKKLKETELAAWRNWLETRQKWLAARGIRYLFVIAPNKHTIYPEFMPGKYAKRHGPTIYDQLLEYLENEKCEVPLLDLRKPLQNAKARIQVYHKRDTHWTDQGAFVGCQEIIGRLSEWFPGLAPPIPDGRFVSFDPFFQPDMAGYQGQARANLKDNLPIYSLPPGEAQERIAFKLPHFPPDPNNVSFTIKTSQPVSGLRAVVLRDSFTTALFRPLSRHFISATFVWRGSTTLFEEDLANVVKAERPDVFIEIMVERHLGSVPLKKKCFGGVSATD